ncbi:DUF4259 domain-containing protein [Pontibacter pamirensis]|uniref:DUF4259 domain-containing protein n=1 Tax=Pontibacter pamirensis TaxID=2562824 RepID=UPI001389456D|nr:DUF4259 domain-containing protein [Pontibacter pamirensis]
MGAWGYGYFEDDAAFDFMAEVEESGNPKNVLKRAFDTAIDSDYLESDEGNAVIVAAAYVDRQLNGTRFSSADQEEPLSVDTFPDRNPQQDLSDLRDKALQALSKVLEDDSELNELWAENEEDYPAWREGVKQLIYRLVSRPPQTPA